MKKYVLKTIQYGEYEDTAEHDTLKDLEMDLFNCAMLTSVQIVEILENGKPMNRIRKRVLLNIARKDAQEHNCLRKAFF